MTPGKAPNLELQGPEGGTRKELCIQEEKKKGDKETLARGGDDVVGIGETSRREERQVNQVRDRSRSEFFQPIAKRNKMDTERDQKPELQEMGSENSLKVPGQLRNILGVDSRQTRLVQGGNQHHLHPELIHVTPGIDTYEGEIDPTSTKS